jgi:hypothetical protein
MNKFNFWKDNRKDQHFQLTGEELTEKFLAWMRQQERDMLEYYSSDRVIRIFITTKDGLSSVFDEEQWDEIFNLCKPVYMEFLYPNINAMS